MRSMILNTFVLFLFFSGCSAIRLEHPLAESGSDWNMFGKNPAHTHFDSSAKLSFPMTVSWKYDATAGFGPGAFSVAGGNLFLGNLQGEFHAVNALTGKRIGFRKFSYPISGSPAIRGAWAFFGLESGKETLIAFDITQNKTVWSAQIGPVISSPLARNGRLYVGSANGFFYCLTDSTGEEMWKVDAKGAIRSSPAASDSFVVFANDNGIIYAVDAATGAMKWQYRTGAAIFGSAMIAEGIVFVGSLDHFLYALELKSGRVLWKHDSGGRIVAAPSGNDSLVFIGSLNGFMSALVKSDGRQVWSFKAKSAINSSAAVTPTALIFGSLSTEVYALSPATGAPLWFTSLGSRIKTTPIVWNNRIFVAAEDRMVYCFRPAVEEGENKR